MKTFVYVTFVSACFAVGIFLAAGPGMPGGGLAAPVAAAQSATSTLDPAVDCTWRSVAPGSSFEVETTRDGRSRTIRQTLVAVTDGEATLRVEALEGGKVVQSKERKQAIPVPGAQPKEVPVGVESVEAAGRTWECAHFEKQETFEGHTQVMDLWMARGVPVPIKMTSSDDGKVTTAVLVKVDRK